MVDTKDLFLEKFVGDKYEYKGKLVSPTVSHERIYVKGRAAPHIEPVWEVCSSMGKKHPGCSIAVANQ
jgi:acyl-homoserine lactone acylase PvdQ